MQPTQPITVTASQLVVFAGNVNDTRIVTEARRICSDLNVNPDLVRAIHYAPPVSAGKPAEITFDLYATDDEGNPLQVPVVEGEDEELDEAPARVLLTQETRPFRGDLPHWWPQAARIYIAPPEQEQQ